MRSERLTYGKPIDQFSLRELVRPTYFITFRCRHCHNSRPVDPIALIAKFGSEVKIETLRFRARCSLCKRRRSYAMLSPVHDVPTPPGSAL